MFFHLHVHQDLNACLNVLENGERIGVPKAVSLLLQHLFIVSVNLYTVSVVNYLQLSELLASATPVTQLPQ